VLADCGRPLLVVPAAGWEQDTGRRVVVGWNATRAAARAVNDALPFLEEAEAVTVLAFQADVEGAAENPMPAASIVEHLALHGVEASYQRAVQGDGGMPVADSLLNCAFETKADLVVAGAQPPAAFRHGGFTARELLASMTAPVLLAG
jgi:nucleotide-binding universal stress UspA family protein